MFEVQTLGRDASAVASWGDRFPIRALVEDIGPLSSGTVSPELELSGRPPCHCATDVDKVVGDDVRPAWRVDSEPVDNSPVDMPGPMAGALIGAEVVGGEFNILT